MHFSDEQLEWIRELMRPPCCHVTGEHDPTHMARYVCVLQLAEIAKVARATFGLSARPDPNETQSVPGCPACATRL